MTNQEKQIEHARMLVDAFAKESAMDEENIEVEERAMLAVRRLGRLLVKRETALRSGR